MVKKKPYKVWDVDRSGKYGVMAASFEDLKTSGKQKLKYGSNIDVRVVLEEDGTEVDDQDYFSCLPENTIFILLKSGEKWHLPEASSDDVDGVDSCDEEEEDDDDVNETDCAYAGHSPQKVRSFAQLASSLRNDFANIHTFSSDEKKKLIERDTSELARRIHRTEMETQNLQMSLQEALDTHLLQNEASDFLRVLKDNYSKQGSKTQTGGSPSRKRKKSK